MATVNRRVVSPAPSNADGIRPEVVARARRLLAEGYFDNTYVLEVAVARLLRQAATGGTGSPGRRAGCANVAEPPDRRIESARESANARLGADRASWSASSR